MNKKLLVIVLVLVLVAGLVVGGVLLLRSSNPKSLPAGRQDQIPNPKVETTTTVVTPTATPIVEATSEAKIIEGETKTFVVEGSSYKFVPAVIKVNKGDNVIITFKNSGGVHDFVIDEFDVKTNQIGEEEEEDVEFVADKTGTFEFYCSVGNHRKMGMVGQLIVE
ncbi:MAG: Plastocyanin [Candidatus Amesbacteria bacterium GW2011_GWA2_42_12]|uniref:Plastocyanin n=1 Tax=Candidatus Amesbacteria bacterium GW2011_GWA2_42_12 TaxID=1618356 RepID=A0A0G0Y7M6_9BACT|nr:MAG: Plastocyanin [Candidatus Amesbacteria bacterium GW2011_GWA2_42_12]